MSAIDVQNAKQIRDPMQVLISLDVPDSISMTYSGYTGTAKLYDSYARLANYYKTWPMRKLADLQADGFPLDGSCALYNSSITPSLANGKLGVRGHTGQTLDLTVSSSSTIKALSLYVTGAASVTYGGTTASITGNQVVIQVNASSVALSFTPIDSTHRVEVSAAIPGTSLVINNANMISATVSLRSDLSLYNQTLPESELNVEVYNDVDISEAVAGIPDDTPITYQAGYAGDMSPVRKFYIAGQVKWKDNVLSIHAVDAVHFLDRYKYDAPVTVTDTDYFLNAADYMLEKAGVSYSGSTSYVPYGFSRAIIPQGMTFRDCMAKMNDMFMLTDDNGQLLDGSGPLNGNAKFQFSFVDAGMPSLRVNRPSTRRRIYEEDCADVDQKIEQSPASISYEWKRITNPNDLTNELPYVLDESAIKVGTATFTKNVGTSLQFDEMAYASNIGLYLGPADDGDARRKFREAFGTVGWGMHIISVVPFDSYGQRTPVQLKYALPEISSPDPVGKKLLYQQIPQEEYLPYPNTGGYKIYSTFVPWGQSYATWMFGNGTRYVYNATQMWQILVDANIVTADATSVDLDICGMAYLTENKTVAYPSGAGSSVDGGEAPFIGQINSRDSSNNNIEIYPSKCLALGAYRSNKTGSFRWKGDPRMQPRDVVTFRRLDGTDEEITLGNITITHEGGGTSAEITYRKGVI